MKILYIDPFAIPDLLGGSQKSLLDIMTEMKNRGNEVILATPGKGLLTIAAKTRGIITIIFFLPNIVSTRITIGTRRIFNIIAAIYDVFIFLLSSFSLFLLIRGKKPDIVHSNQMLISIAAGLACKLVKIPCVWHIRENPAAHIPGSVLKIFGIFGSLLSDKVIVNSQYTADIFCKTSLYNKIVVVPIGIENTIDHRNNELVTSRDKGAKSTRVISIFGRIIHMKGHEILLKSLKILKEKQLDYELMILGHFDKNDPYYLSLLSYIEELNLISCIQFFGFIPDINSYMNSSDIIVSASTESETFGRTIIEAMAAGKPVVATRVGAHPEIIVDGVTGFLVEPGNPEQLADKIELLLTNNELAEEMGQHGREQYKKYFTLEKYCNNIDDIYAIIIN